MALTKEDLKNIEKLFSKRFDSIDRKFEVIDKKFDLIDRRLNFQDKRMDNFVDAVIERFDKVDRKIDLIDKKFFRINTKINIAYNRLDRAEENISSIIRTIKEYDLPNLDHTNLKSKLRDKGKGK